MKPKSTPGVSFPLLLAICIQFGVTPPAWAALSVEEKSYATEMALGHRTPFQNASNAFEQSINVESLILSVLDRFPNLKKDESALDELTTLVWTTVVDLSKAENSTVGLYKTWISSGTNSSFAVKGIKEYFKWAKRTGMPSTLIIGCGHHKLTDRMPLDLKFKDIYDKGDYLRKGGMIPPLDVANPLVDHRHGNAITVNTRSGPRPDLVADWSVESQPNHPDSPPSGLGLLWDPKSGEPFRFDRIHFEFATRNVHEHATSYRNVLTHIQSGGEFIIDGMSNETQDYIENSLFSFIKGIGNSEITKVFGSNFERANSLLLKVQGTNVNSLKLTTYGQIALMLRILGFESFLVSTEKHPINGREKTDWMLAKLSPQMTIDDLYCSADLLNRFGDPILKSECKSIQLFKEFLAQPRR